MNKPLMPKATAVWLLDNTSLTFEQIANFCALPLLEVRAIADGEMTLHIQARDPILAGELTEAEIKRCQEDTSAQLHMRALPFVAQPKGKKQKRYTPIIKRQNKPDAIAWILKYHPEVSDVQIVRLIGTTKSTIKSIQDRTHRNMSHLKPGDPVLLGLCTQAALNEVIEQAKAEQAKQEQQSSSPATLDSSFVKIPPEEGTVGFESSS